MVFVFVPAVFLAILLLPWVHHLAINLICIVVSILGAFETAHLFASHGMPANGGIFPLVGGIFPLAAYLEVVGILPTGTILPVLLTTLAVVFAREIFIGRPEGFPAVLPRLAASVTVVIYPGLFLSYIVRFSALQSAGLSLIVFLLIVFANDTFAYLAGSFWGKGTRGFLPVSPNKSVVGFAGGMAGSLLLAYVCWVLFPYVFHGSLGLAFAVGAGVGILTILGDLIESAMKRSSNVKDSGSAIPGRGGVLDSIDSILLAGPFCYYLLSLVGR